MKLNLFLIAFFSFILFNSNNLNGQSNQTIKSLSFGEFTVYKLQETEFNIPTSALKPINDDKMPILAEDSIYGPANTFLIKTPNQIILVDAGLGFYNSNSEKILLELLKNVNVEPYQVDKILITHFHYDHIHGLTDSLGNAIFPNAAVYVSKQENDYWLNNPNNLLEKHKEWAKKIPGLLAPYMNANKYNTFQDNEIIADGIQAILAPGHTMGHTIYSFTSKGQTLWFIGDLMHLRKIQFEHPRLGISFDTKPELAVETRQKKFEQAEQSSVIIAASHDFDFLKIKIEGNKIVETPLNDQ